MVYDGVLEPQPQPYNITKIQSCPKFSKKPHPPTLVEQCNGAPMCHTTAYQGAKPLCILWMWDAVYGVLEPQLQPYIITKIRSCPPFSKNPHPPALVEQCNGAPMCPSTAYQGAKTLCIYMIWMWNAVCWA